MSEKWDKEQIERAKGILRNKGCGSIKTTCEEDGCLMEDKQHDCFFFIDGEIKKLLQQHEHDADELICKQTTPPHIGTTRVLDYVLADLKSRAEMGKQKYGHYLETNNGRNALQDAYEEALDMCMYLKQKLLEEKGK